MSECNKPECDRDKKVRAPLAHRLIATYLWPFSGGEWYVSKKRPTIRSTFNSAVKSTKKLLKLATVFAATIVAHQFIQPTTGMLFPTAEDYLREHGLDPAYAQQLSDHDIHIRGRNLPGMIHVAFDLPTAPGIVMGILLSQEQQNAFAMKGFRFGGYGTYNLLNQCNTYLLPEGTSAESMISAMTGIPEKDIENMPISDEELHVSVAFHEFAHCDSSNDQPAPIPEGDADVRGMFLAAEALNNPAIKDVFLYARAMSQSSHSHDVVLYLDAELKGEPLPHAEQLAGPTDDAFALAEIYEKRNYLYGPSYVRKAKALNAILDNHGDLLSEMGKRRAELYIEAVKYFVPSRANEIDNYELRQTPTAPVIRLNS